MNPAENKQPETKPESEPPAIADDPLNGVIGAAVGEPADEPELPPDPKPEIQSGKTPSIEDAFADMSEPPPAPPLQYLRLTHSSTLPKASFRVQPRVGEGVHLWMFDLPWGTALQGEAFVHPIVASLRKQLMRECPVLTPKRYEIRLILDATGKYSLLEVPADKLPTKRGEDTRQSFLALLGLAEKEVMFPVKPPGGLWATTRGAIDFPDVWPEQSIGELVSLSYDGELITAMNHAILQRYRIK
jgi:hypothetical protein